MPFCGIWKTPLVLLFLPNTFFSPLQSKGNYFSLTSFPFNSVVVSIHGKTLFIFTLKKGCTRWIRSRTVTHGGCFGHVLFIYRSNVFLSQWSSHRTHRRFFSVLPRRYLRTCEKTSLWKRTTLRTRGDRFEELTFPPKLFHTRGFFFKGAIVSAFLGVVFVSRPLVFAAWMIQNRLEMQRTLSWLVTFFPSALCRAFTVRLNCYSQSVKFSLELCYFRLLFVQVLIFVVWIECVVGASVRCFLGVVENFWHAINDRL